MYCRRYWPDLPEVCRKRPRKKKMDLTKNNFSLTAFFLRSQPQHFADTCHDLTDVFEGEKNGNIYMYDLEKRDGPAMKLHEKVFIPSLEGSSVRRNFVDQTFSINFKTNSCDTSISHNSLCKTGWHQLLGFLQPDLILLNYFSFWKKSSNEYTMPIRYTSLKYASEMETMETQLILTASLNSCWIFANLLHPGRHIVVQEPIHRAKCPCDILTQNPWNLLKYFPCNFQESWAGCIPRSMQSVIWMPPSMKIFEKPSKNIL